jgi:predicted metal-dependent hydrolase
MPGPVWFLTTSLRFFKPNYHPFYEASTELAQSYLAQSAGVLAHQQKAETLTQVQS